MNKKLNLASRMGIISIIIINLIGILDFFFPSILSRHYLLLLTLSLVFFFSTAYFGYGFFLLGKSIRNLFLKWASLLFFIFLMIFWGGYLSLIYINSILVGFSISGTLLYLDFLVLGILACIFGFSLRRTRNALGNNAQTMGNLMISYGIIMASFLFSILAGYLLIIVYIYGIRLLFEQSKSVRKRH